MVKITAVIPIRSGSQRVKGKNLRPFANTTLMENKINSLLQVPELDSIIVNTNSEEAIEIVKKKYSGRVKWHRREEYYASSQCSGSEFFQHLGEVTDTDIFVMHHVHLLLLNQKPFHSVSKLISTKLMIVIALQRLVLLKSLCGLMVSLSTIIR